MIVNLTKRLFAKLSRKAYRDSYVAEHVRTSIAYQIKAIREQQGMNQGEFALKLGVPQSTVSGRLENPDYGKLSLTSLLDVASALDVALLVRYVSFPDFLRWNQDVSTDALVVDKFDEDAFIATSSPERMIVDTATMRTPVVRVGKPPSGPTRMQLARSDVMVN